MNAAQYKHSFHGDPCHSNHSLYITNKFMSVMCVFCIFAGLLSFIFTTEHVLNCNKEMFGILWKKIEAYYSNKNSAWYCLRGKKKKTEEKWMKRESFTRTFWTNFSTLFWFAPWISIKWQAFWGRTGPNVLDRKPNRAVPSTFDNRNWIYSKSIGINVTLMIKSDVNNSNLFLPLVTP